jgi:hypothetical protein
LSFDNLNDAAGPRFNQNRAPVHHCVSIFAYTVLRRHIVIGNALLRKNRPDSQVFAVLIRRAPLFDDIRTEARTFIDPEHAGDTANDAADHATNNRPDGTRRPFTVSGTPLDATRDALGPDCGGKEQGDNNSSGSDKSAVHSCSLDGDLGRDTSCQRRIGSQ